MSNLTSDELHHAGRKGMKWGMNIFGRRQAQGGVRGKRGAKPEQQNIKMPKKPRRSVDERLREAEFRDAYRTRDNMSTKALKSKIARLEAEQRFKQLVEAPEKARLEALQKKKQARLAFIGKVGSAALDVYSKAPSSIAGRNLSGQAAKDAIEAFKKRQEWAKAFKDVPTTMTKFTQSINVGGVDVYIPESVQNRFMIQHAGRKGMKWGMNIFGKRDRYARNNFSKEHYQTYKYVRERVKKGKSEYKLSKKIHRLTKDLYNSQPTEQNRLLTNVAYDARKDAKATRKKYKGSVKKIFNKYSETDFDLKGGLTQSGVNMGEIINGVYIPSQDDLLLHYGKKGMKWKKHLTNGVNSALEGIENAANWIDDQTFDKDRDRALRDRSEANKRRINDPKYGKTYNTASDPVDGKKNVDVKRALREGRDNVVPSRSREGMRQENKYIEKIRKRVKLPRLKQGISSEDTLLHYGKKGMKWKKRKGQLTEEELAAGNDNPGGNVLREEERRYKEAAKNALNKIKGGIQDGKAKNKNEQKYLDQHNDAMRKMLKAKENADKADSIAKKNGAGKKKANSQDTSSLRKEESRYKKEAKDAFNKIKGGIQNGKAKNKSEQKYLDQHNAATSKMLKAKEKADKAEAKTKKKVKHSGISEDTLLHYGKKGMKWKKKGGASDLMTPAEVAANEARVKKDDKAYNYNLKMRDEAIKNALKRGASGKEIRRLQDMRVEDQRKVDMNNRHKKALKNKDNRRSSYSREVTVADAKSGKLKTYKY